MVGKTALGRYRLLRSLGSGSNGEAFLAEPLRFPQYRVVVKRIHDHVVTHPKFRQYFEAEVRSMANFDHPYTVGLIEASLDDPIGPCLVMEYVPGVTLEVLLLQAKRLDLERTGRLLGCMCHALQAAHARGIIHRDLKPANLMVMKPFTPEESLKVMDFGFAGFAAKPHIQLAELTGHGPIYAIGTPGYVSPEMIRGDRVDSRSDLYSVGVILYEMLSGRRPFTYNIMERLLAAHIKETPPGFQRIGCAFVPPSVEGVVQLALSKFPNERQQTAFELIENYGRALGVNFWDATTPPNWEPLAESYHGPDSTPAAFDPEATMPKDPYHVLYGFEVTLPERMAAAKLRGFVDDCRAEVLASEPGLIRMRLGLPDGFQQKKQKGSGILSWFGTSNTPTIAPGQEPVEIELHMEKPNPSHPRLNVLVSFQPLREYPPKDRHAWHARCEKLNKLLRQYLGA
jgi:eukaryotic-like serine/threonine-protein kinase